MGIKRRTGVSMPKHLLLKMAFDSGYEAGAEDAGSGELLVEAQARLLQHISVCSCPL